MINGLEFQIPANVNNPVVWIVVLVLALLLFGGQKLPELMRSLGKSKNAFEEGLKDKGDDELNKDKAREDEIRKRVEAEMRKEDEARAAGAK